MAAVTMATVILELQKIKSDSVSTVSPSISHEVWDQMLKCVLNMFVFSVVFRWHDLVL